MREKIIEYEEDIRRMMSVLEETEREKLLQHIREYIEDFLKD